MKSDEVRLGAVSYDPTTRALSHKDGSQAQLRNKSKEVLHVLATHPNQIVTKSALLDSVWADVAVSDESLVQCIADIRRLIGDQARHIVETVPREGYRLNPVADPPSKPAPKRALVFAGSACVLAALAFAFWPAADAPPPSPDPAPAQKAPTSPPGTDIVEAYLEVLQGRVSANRFSYDESLTAERHFRRAIDLDPDYARAYAEMGTLFAIRFENDWTVLEEADKEKALFFAEKAVALDPDLWLAHYALGRLQSVFADFEAAQGHLERAMSLQPDNEDARAYLGIVRNLQGDADGAIAILRPALTAHPNPPYWYHLGLGHSLFNADKYEEAEQELLACLRKSQNSPYCLRYLIAVYGALERGAEAQKALATYREAGFEPSITAILDLLRFHIPDDLEKLERAYRAAGLPE